MINNKKENLEKILGVTFPHGIKISNTTNSTKKVKKDSIYFGLQGSNTHGSKYIKKAFELGASIAIHNDESYKPESKNIFFVSDLEDMDRQLKNKIYYFLEEFYKVFDIQNNNNFFTFTGTNGKTTSAYLCHQLLVNKGYESIYIGTLGTQYNNTEFNNSISSKTTPDIFELFEIFKFYNFSDSVSVCIEMSSHALEQKRLKNISSLNSCSVLNIGTDHLDYHGNIQNYTNAKFKIFDNTCAVNLIDFDLISLSNNYSFVKNTSNGLTSISNNNKSADIYYEITESSFKRSLFEVTINNPPVGYFPYSKKKYIFSCNLFPDFNIDNLVYAISSIGFSDFIENEINDLSYLTTPKGRAELIKNLPINVIIDFAHNAEGVELFLSSIKKYFEDLVIVFGCGGDRDKFKRPKMLATAIKFGSKVIFTSDNSRSEEFKDIFSDASNGNNIKNVINIEDRREAIIEGTKLIRHNDCLVILGKGHEETQEINGKSFYFSDHEVVNEIYK